MKENLQYAQALLKLQIEKPPAYHKEHVEEIQGNNSEKCILIGDSLLSHLEIDWILSKEGVQLS